MITPLQKHNLKIIYEEAISRPRNSPGAWHTRLIEFLREIGYPARNYQEAKTIVERLLFGSKKNAYSTIYLSARDKGE